MNRRTGGKQKEKLIQHNDGDNDGDYEEKEETFKMAMRCLYSIVSNFRIFGGQERDLIAVSFLFSGHLNKNHSAQT